MGQSRLRRETLALLAGTASPETLALLAGTASPETLALLAGTLRGNGSADGAAETLRVCW
jgi:hypothetical protein